MLFTRLGWIAAWILLVSGVASFAIGLIVASIADEQQRALATQRYLGTGTSGDAIEQGLLGVGLAIALGMLCEISRNISSRSQ